jgi:hypothetical protein
MEEFLGGKVCSHHAPSHLMILQGILSHTVGMTEGFDFMRNKQHRSSKYSHLLLYKIPASAPGYVCLVAQVRRNSQLRRR